MTLLEKLQGLKHTQKELRSFQGWQADPVSKPIAPETAGKMLALFLRGYSTQEIHEQEQFRGFTLGAIVHARLAGDWDAAHGEVASRIRESMVEQAVQTGEETARTVCDLLACANKKLGKEAREYLAGFREELPVEVKSVSQLKALAELFQMTLDPKNWPHGTEKPPEAPKKGAVQEDEEERDPAPLAPEQRLAELAARARKGLIGKPPVEA